MMPDPGKAQEYLEVQVRTASPDQLLLMLLDGAVRFAEGGLEGLRRGDREAKSRLLMKAQVIVLELIGSLKREVGEKLYGNLTGLYKFIYTRLVEGNLRDDAGAVEDALKILRDLRETWRQAVTVFRSGAAAAASAPPPTAVPAASICLQA